ncbi:MAG: type II toxin-antitoxin system HicB family antitoxin [Chloroflexi bacterium]|nr:type II toxin-antitoxin system HicB family antitoxin [Chloroflexota bacterium]MCZ6867852.1 type II toxin-antitoxin system HicB family antitoxin [Chloroflexota bacterium]
MLDGSLKYTVSYKEDEDGYIVASVPALPGCHSQGHNREEASKNIREAMKGYLASMKHHGEPIPKEDVEIVQVTL